MCAKVKILTGRRGLSQQACICACVSIAKHAKKKLFERVKLKWQHFAVILNYKSVVCVCLGVEH